jgi:hypothetical protein
VVFNFVAVPIERGIPRPPGVVAGVHTLGRVAGQQGRVAPPIVPDLGEQCFLSACTIGSYLLCQSVGAEWDACAGSRPHRQSFMVRDGNRCDLSVYPWIKPRWTRFWILACTRGYGYG